MVSFILSAKGMRNASSNSSWENIGQMKLPILCSISVSYPLLAVFPSPSQNMSN